MSTVFILPCQLETKPIAFLLARQSNSLFRSQMTHAAFLMHIWIPPPLWHSSPAPPNSATSLSHLSSLKPALLSTEHTGENSPYISTHLGYTCTCHKLWTEICEIRQNFKGGLIKFCTKPQNSQKPLFKCVKLVLNTTKCDLCLCVVRWSEHSVRFVKSYGNPMGQNLWDFITLLWDMAGMLEPSHDIWVNVFSKML